ncbi:GRAM domain-containing protein 2B-like isoform X2 [Ptychodera flava]|uniref:GRAM domain-containing protein 2B-like isoform X2 n=1 Tax=Ptychodera flava TaxID=63121 RepID=UPI00396A5129
MIPLDDNILEDSSVNAADELPPCSGDAAPSNHSSRHNDDDHREHMSGRHGRNRSLPSYREREQMFIDFDNPMSRGVHQQDDDVNMTHVARVLANNTCALLLTLDHKMVAGAFSSKSTRSSLSSEKSGSSNDAIESPKSEKVGNSFADCDGTNEDNLENNNLSHKSALMKKSGRRKKVGRSKSFGGVTDILNGAISKIDDSRNRHFHKLFKHIPQEEYAITSYTCALLKGTILLQGRLYVARNWFCFHSNIFGKETQVIIPVLTVKSITRERTAFVVPNAIGVRTIDDKKHVFGSLLSRPVTYKTLVTIWQSVLRDYAEEVRQKELAEAAQNAARATEEFSSNDGEDEMDSPLPLIDRPITEATCHDDPDGTQETKRNRYIMSLTTFLSWPLTNAYNSVLRPVQLIQRVPHTHMFIMFASVLAIFLVASSILMSYRILQLQPILETKTDPAWTPEQQHANHLSQAYSDSYLLNHRVHTAAVEHIHATLAANLEALSQVQSSLEVLKQRAVKQQAELTDNEGKQQMNLEHMQPGENVEL